MKKLLAAFLAGATLASAGVAGAESLVQNWRKNGYICQSSSAGISCIPQSARGYGVGMHRDFLFVWDIRNERRVFTRMQP